MLTDGKLSREQVANIFNYVTLINAKNDKEVKTSRKWQLLNTKLNLVRDERNQSILKTIMINYNKVELTLIDVLETLITLLENALFLMKFMKKSPRLTGYLNILILKISKIWMVLTVKSSIWRFWKLTKLEKVMDVSQEDNKLILKLKNYTLINLGLCIVEIIELLDLKQFSWLVSIYNVYRMVGNGSLCLEDDEEKIVQLLFLEYDI